MRLRFVTSATLTLALSSCLHPTPAPAPVDSSAPTATMVVPAPARVATLDTTAWVDSTLASLSLRQRAAQLVVLWTLGDYTSVDDSAFAEVVKWVEQEGVGGLNMSLGTPIEVAAKLNYLQRRARVPLLVSADLEPSLMRLETAVYPHYLLETGGATAFPPQMAIAATGRDDDIYAVARAIAEEGRAAGMHVNFAPTADVNNNPNNPVIAIRSFGEDPERVARLTALFVKGTHDGGLRATAKHFPGHGDTDVDSHVGLPVVQSDMARLQALELRPFRAAIAEGADLVMSAHIALPALGGDSSTPATLRPDVMKALLRDSLGFRGVAITDALSMEGIGKGYTKQQAAVLALKAGTDILLNGPAGDASATIQAVVDAVQNGELTAARVDSSVRRILWLKARAGVVTRRFVDLENIRQHVATAEHKALALDVAQRAVTLLRDSGLAVPVAKGTRVAVVNYMPETELKAGRAFQREITRLLPGSRVVSKISPATSVAQLDSIARLLAGADAVVLAAYVRRVEGEGRTTVAPHIAAWIDSVSAGPRSAFVAFGNPYILKQFPRARTYINAFGVGDALEVAVARALAGTAPVSGTTPVSLPGFFNRGDGLKR
jgi:beta-N-acetylhexosaminidase